MTKADITRRRFLATTAGAAAALAVANLPLGAAGAAEKFGESSVVPYEELRYRGCRTSRLLVCKWEDRYRLHGHLAGIVRGDGKIILQAKPQEHPRFPGMYAFKYEFHAHGCRFVPLENLGPTIPAGVGVWVLGPKQEMFYQDHEHAVFTVHYAPAESIPGMGA